MITLEALLKALKSIIPFLPKAAQRFMPGVLGVLPLVYQIVQLLYKHRKEIKDIIDNLGPQTSDQVRKETQDQVRKETQAIEETIPHLPKRVARWLKRRLTYFPLALEIAKASTQRNIERVRSLTAPLPSKVKRKIRRILRRYHRRSRWNLFCRFQR